MADAPSTSSKKRNRSPNNPSLSLERAIERAEVLYRETKGHPIPVGESYAVWDFEPGSSQGSLCVAALNAYGLADFEGSGPDRTIKVSESGRRIVLGSPDRDKLIREAAILPPIWGELWTKFGASWPVPPAPIRSYLLFQRDGTKFNDDVVDGVVERFAATISFAGLPESGIIEQSEEEAEGQPMTENERKLQPAVKLPAPNNDCLPLPVLENGEFRIVNIPRMSERAFEFLKNALETYKAAIVIKPPPDGP